MKRLCVAVVKRHSSPSFRTPLLETILLVSAFTRLNVMAVNHYLIVFSVQSKFRSVEVWLHRDDFAKNVLGPDSLAYGGHTLLYDQSRRQQPERINLNSGDD